MRAMQLLEPRTPLVATDRELPPPDPHQVVVQISACGVCRTDLHESLGVHRFFALAARLKLETSVVEYELDDANRALADLRDGRPSGAAVLIPE